jgi:hypothetical protein
MHAGAQQAMPMCSCHALARIVPSVLESTRPLPPVAMHINHARATLAVPHAGPVRLGMPHGESCAGLI